MARELNVGEARKQKEDRRARLQVCFESRQKGQCSNMQLFKFVTPGCSFKNVLIGSIKPTTLNVTPGDDVILEKIILDEDEIADPGSIKPTTLYVTPGDEVILEKIILDEDQIVDPSVLKGFHEAFKDKYVCIFLLPMSPGHKNSLALNTTRLRDVHEQIKSSGGKFHVICVPTHIEHNEDGNEDDFEYFNPHHEHSRIKSRTLFHHISINNSACLKRMERMIGSSKEAAYVIIGPMKGSCRKVVAILDSDFIKWHGAEAFPFTTEKIQQLACEDEALWSGKHDLGTLLSIPDRDYVISNNLTKVPISDLHQRTVCVLFYEDTSECRNWTEKLKKLYVARKDFEVVVVFSITFGQVCSDTPKLLIIYSGGKYFKENGFKVLEETGFKNYPFMRLEVVRTSVTAVREKNLSSFLGRNELIRGRDYDHARRKKFTASKLLGGSVVLLFLGVSGFRGFSDLLTGLEFNHVGCFWSVEKFEIVYIPVTESLIPHGIDCGWMLASRCKEQLIPCFSHFFEDEINQNPGEQFTMAMVSFGQFGHYNNRGIIYSNCSQAAFELFLDTFPFKDNEEKEGFKFLYTAAINKPKEEDYV
ncbi:hypothetical protein POM88_051512 [Heracleum sosnowskyi]|uniref:Uncharacterized protein n=1 Tax=Heracleum sosnowskyi TaxID=360622 RepID=A0AAD8H2D6_9APIA|nr:hypothetical protein POM88_051512 [Heracleum sosnowskyi]